MYEDKDPWPLKCPECGEEFTKEIGWLKTHSEVGAASDKRLISIDQDIDFGDVTLLPEQISCSADFEVQS
jgi:hypothetical protein